MLCRASTLFLPLPGWMQALSFGAPLIGGLIGNHLVRGGRRAGPLTTEAEARRPNP